MTKRAFLVLGILLAAGEAAVRLTHADARLMWPLLRYHMDYEISAFRPSQNPNLIYELAPNKECKLPINTIMSTNSLGFRDRERTAFRPPDVYRIICLGGDFVYGTEVRDKETYPYQLEELLNKNYKGRFEVWNTGIRNGTLAYQAELARVASSRYSPDLLLFQTGDTGARAFLPDMNLPHYFDNNKQLYRENLRFLPFPISRLSGKLLNTSALYRFIVVFMNNFILINENNSVCSVQNQPLDMLNLWYLDRFYSVPRDVPALTFTDYHFENEALKTLPDKGKNLAPRLVNCFSPEHMPAKTTDEYLAKRPPAHVLRWYAGCVAKELEKHGYISRK